MAALRFSIPILAGALLAGCGGSDGAEKAAENGFAAEVTMRLPPPAPGADAPGTDPIETAKAPEQPPAPQPKTKPKAEPEPPMELAPSRPPIPQATLAPYIRRAGFECDEVTAVSRPRGRTGIYKFDCTTGGSYRGTMRNNHLYFRPWTGS